MVQTREQLRPGGVMAMACMVIGWAAPSCAVAAGRQAGFIIPQLTHQAGSVCRVNLVGAPSRVIMAATPTKEKRRVEGITEDDPLVQRIRDDVKRETGVDLDQLMNPSKVVNLEFDLINLRNELQDTTDKREVERINKTIAKKEDTLAQEKRMVMRGWLKNLFLSQSLLAIALSGLVAYDALPGFTDLPLPIRAFAFWSWWMFTIPSLRARKPGKVEKRALDVAFLLTPIVSLGMPFLTQDVPTIWLANAIATGVSYGGAYALVPREVKEGEEEDADLPGPIRAALKALDWGSGRERGARR